MRFLVAIAVLLSMAASGYTSWLFWPRPLDLSPSSPLPRLLPGEQKQMLVLPRGLLLAELARFDDELYAYLMFDHLRGRPGLNDREILLTYSAAAPGAPYAVIALPGSDLLGMHRWLAGLAVDREIAGYEWRVIDQSGADLRRRQSAVFEAAYNMPVRRELGQLSRREKEAYLRRFLRFKSETDPRVRLGEPVPRLTSDDASRLAADILTVSEFYSVPLDFFLGIGAMENNYMNVKGDIGNAVWKRRAQKGDIIIRRSRGRVLVLNESSGVWQITRETLRYVHRLYLKDERDYSRLPRHLVPPRQLDLNEVQPAHLTTYAGLLFRHLLDEFKGDVQLAVGAYNGGWGNPNLHYAEGVERAANHARRVMEQAAALQGRLVAETPYISPANGPAR